MIQIEIIDERPEEREPAKKMTKQEILDYIRNNGCYSFLSNYSVPEEFILENHELFDKSTLLQSPMRLSESFVGTAIESGYLSEEDIREMNMVTYSGFSPEFIASHGESINWGRMLMYVSTQFDNFDAYVDVIERDGLWGLISANDLPVDFIREWKHMLDWRFLSLVKNFTDAEKEEFADFIVAPEKTPEGEFSDYINPLSGLEPLSDDELDDLIDKINKSFGQ